MTSSRVLKVTIDPEIGYPRKFERICKGELRSRYIRYPCGPPTAFSAGVATINADVDVAALEVQFPVIPEDERASTSTERFRDILWKQLDSLRGFDDSLIRVDKYGNVLYRLAEPGSPLYGQIDHWFPVARGGLSVLPNLFTIQWEANKHKSDQLEFLVPWYDLQCGIHFTRFLSTFASTDLLLRKRMFMLFFGPQGETHELVTEWSAPNLSRTAYIAQAVVTMDPVGSGDKGPGAVRSIKKGEQRRSTNAWTAEETAQLQRAVQKHGAPGQTSLPMQKWKEIHASAEFSIFRKAKREPKDLYDKWRNLLKGGSTRRSSAPSRSASCGPASPSPALSSPATARQLFSQPDENRPGTPSQTRITSWVQSQQPAGKGARAMCQPQKLPRGFSSVPRPPLSQRDQNGNLGLEAAFARSCRLSDSSSDDSDAENNFQGDWDQDRASERQEGFQGFGARPQVVLDQRPRSGVFQTGIGSGSVASHKENFPGRDSGRSREEEAHAAAVEQNLELIARCKELEAQKEKLRQETALAVQRREDLLCEVALVEQETREQAGVLEVQCAENQVLAEKLSRAKEEKDALDREGARARQRKRALEGTIQAREEELARMEKELEGLQEAIRGAEEAGEGLLQQVERAEEALEREEELVQRMRQDLADARNERATLKKKIQACKDERLMLEAKTEELKDSCMELSMRLELDLPELRRWHIRAEECEQRASLARQNEAAAKQGLQKVRERLRTLQSELVAAQEAARSAESSKRKEHQEVASLQGQLKEVRENRKRSQEECEKLRLKRGALEARLRHEEEGLLDSKTAEERERAALQEVVEGLERVIVEEEGAKEGGEATSTMGKLKRVVAGNERKEGSQQAAYEDAAGAKSAREEAVWRTVADEEEQVEPETEGCSNETACEKEGVGCAERKEQADAREASRVKRAQEGGLTPTDEDELGEMPKAEGSPSSYVEDRERGGNATLKEVEEKPAKARSRDEQIENAVAEDGMGVATQTGEDNWEAGTGMAVASSEHPRTASSGALTPTATHQARSQCGTDGSSKEGAFDMRCVQLGSPMGEAVADQQLPSQSGPAFVDPDPQSSATYSSADSEAGASNDALQDDDSGTQSVAGRVQPGVLTSQPVAALLVPAQLERAEAECRVQDWLDAATEPGMEAAVEVDELDEENR